MNQQSKKRFEREQIKFPSGILLLISIIIIISASLVSASGDVYKTYLHNPVVPKHLDLALQGDYQTALWPGAATFNYPIQVVSGTNGLAPLLTISYNHQLTSGRPSIAGTGCSLLENYIKTLIYKLKDVFYTTSNKK